MEKKELRWKIDVNLREEALERCKSLNIEFKDYVCSLIKLDLILHKHHFLVQTDEQLFREAQELTQTLQNFSFYLE